MTVSTFTDVNIRNEGYLTALGGCEITVSFAKIRHAISNIRSFE
jgi:hypothetical protein